MKTTSPLVTLAAAILLLQVTIAAFCPAGYYRTSNIERPCLGCSIGSYCPGDDKMYYCADGTAAPRVGQSKCDECESKRSSITHFYCVLPDAPLDAKEAVHDTYSLEADKPYWFTRVLFGDFGGYTGDVAQYTFVDTMPILSRSLVVYASRKTGKPGPDNYEFKGEGQNVTLVIPRQEGEYNTVVYFNVVTVDKRDAIFVGKGYYWLSKNYQLTEETTVIDTGIDLARWPDTAARFVIDKVPANSLVNFTVSMEGMRFHENDVQFKLYYTSLKTVDYPNVNNAQVAVTSRKGTVSHAGLVAKVTDGGPFYVSLATTTIYDARLVVKATVTRQLSFN